MAKHDFYISLVDDKGRKKLFEEIKNVKQFIKVKLTVLELLSSQWKGDYNTLNINTKEPYLHFNDKDQHRVYIVSNNKIISFGIRLTVQADSVKILNLRIGKNVITDRHISEAQAILASWSDDVLYCDLTDDNLEEIPSNEGKILFNHLLYDEPAYIRYDYDKQSARGERWIIHPAHHFDINFTPNYTYKFGLQRGINEKEFRDIIGSELFCRRISLKNGDFKEGSGLKVVRKNIKVYLKCIKNLILYLTRFK